MPKLKSFIASIAKKANVDLTTDEAKAFYDALPDTDVPEAINTGIDNSLLSLTDAKNNHPDIQNHYKAQVLSGLDSTINSIIDELGLDDQTKADILGERSSYKRVGVLTKKIKDLEHGKGKNSSNATQQEIDRLQAELRQEKAKLTQKDEEYQGKLLSFKIQDKVKALVAKGQFPTIYDGLDDELRFRNISDALAMELQAKNAKWHLDENENLTIIKNDGTTFYTDNHQVVVPKPFVESNLTRNKIIVPPTQALSGTTGKQTAPAGANGTPAGNKNAQPGVADYNTKQAAAMLASLKDAPLAI